MSSPVKSFGKMKTKLEIGNNSSATLQEDSRRMEERLHMLKKMMSIEKASREASDGRFWKSSQIGTNSQSPFQTRPVLDQKSVNGVGSKKSIKLLTDSGTQRESSRVRVCGQCDKPSAKLVCIECMESYCLTCFAKFHQRGALSKHRVKPIKVKGLPRGKPSLKTSHATNTPTTSSIHQKNSNNEHLRRNESEAVTVKDSEKSLMSSVEREEGGGAHEKQAMSDVGRKEGGSVVAGGERLWEGEYDEETSAKSFQEALAAWRSTGVCSDTACTKSTESRSSQVCGTQTMPQDSQSQGEQKPTAHINFNKYRGGVSYLEKMMIRRQHFVNPETFTTPHPNLHAPGHHVDNTTSCRANDKEEDDDECGPSRYNLFHSCNSTGTKPLEHYSYYSSLHSLPTGTTSAEFTAGGNDTTALINRPRSSVRIEELKFTSDDDYSDETSRINNSQTTSNNNEASQSKEKKAVYHVALDQRRKLKLLKTAEKEKSGNIHSKRRKPQPLANTDKRQGNDNKCSCVSKNSEPVHQSFMETTKEALKSHKHHTIIKGMSDSAERLSQFFLSGVKETEGSNRELKAEKNKDKNESSGSGSKSSLPISASIWLPQNSVLHREEDREEMGRLTQHCLESSIYCIETDIPPPNNPCPASYNCSTSVVKSSVKHNTYTSSTQLLSVNTMRGPSKSVEDQYTHSANVDSETEEEEDDDSDVVLFETFGDHLSIEDRNAVNEAYGRDSDTLEDLAWELQQKTMKHNRSSGGECDGEEEEEEWMEEEWEIEEIELEIERVKSSFEIYQHQIMQQDSD